MKPYLYDLVSFDQALFRDQDSMLKFALLERLERIADLLKAQLARAEADAEWNGTLAPSLAHKP